MAMRGRPTTDLTQPVHEQDHILGPSDADVTLVEYGDLNAPTRAKAPVPHACYKKA
jgi:hypothetical protein